jgi:hypothetical protein
MLNKVSIRPVYIVCVYSTTGTLGEGGGGTRCKNKRKIKNMAFGDEELMQKKKVIISHVNVKSA